MILTILFVFSTLIAVIWFLYTQNNRVMMTNYTVRNQKLPREFDGFTIIHLSDLHNKNFNQNFFNRIENIGSDLVVITGDLIDSRFYNEMVAIRILKKIKELKKEIYYVTGNHEWRSGKYNELKSDLEQIGVKILDNKSVTIHRNKHRIHLIGVDDPRRYSRNRRNYSRVKEEIKKLNDRITNPSFKILLSHRPELYDFYCSLEIDLVLSGHAHGGQIRLPKIGGLFAPHQGFFPRFSGGLINQRKTTMVVSRGLGNSIFPQRLFNRPEIVVITLKV